MSFRFTVLLVIALLTFGLISDADAFDGNRRGFIIGLGLGVGVTSFTYSIKESGWGLTLDRERKLGLQTNFRIGYAPNEFFQIYFVNKVSYYGMEKNFNNHVSIAHGVSGLGLTIYLQPVAPSYFITGVIGLSTWSTLFENSPELYGEGFAFGFGYEFVRHWSIEVSVSQCDPSRTEFGRIESCSALTFRVSVNVLEY